MAVSMHKGGGLLSRLQKKRLQVKTKKRGAHKGTRQSSGFGSSLEFSDFRLYQPGDDVRQIDWNVFGRTQKHYIKRFLDEQEISAAVYLDTSSSMQSIDQKWKLAKELAASLCYIALSGGDRLYFASLPSGSKASLRRKGANYSKQVYAEILQLEGAGINEGYSDHLSPALQKNQQLSILITDTMEPLSGLESAMKRIGAMKQDFWLLQILAKEEAEPNYSGDIRLIDSESSTSVNVSMNPVIVDGYKKRLEEHGRQLEAACRKYGGQFVPITADTDIQTILLRILPGKGMLN
ncbi:DUF58 domain-containing protein [Bacillus infantis]|nr:DUF58 domain-containing protein [Bacillus infantis]